MCIYIYIHVRPFLLSPFSCVRLFTLRDPMHYSPSGFSVHEILQARILEWVASLLSHALASRFFISNTTWEAYTHTRIHTYICTFQRQILGNNLESSALPPLKLIITAYESNLLVVFFLTSSFYSTPFQISTSLPRLLIKTSWYVSSNASFNSFFNCVKIISLKTKYCLCLKSLLNCKCSF